MSLRLSALCSLLALPFLAACPTPPLDAIPLDAGLFPEGGGTVDARLAGCQWTEHIERTDDGAVSTRVVDYDAEGRTVRVEVSGTDVNFVTETTYDADGCPAAGVDAFPEGADGATGSVPWAQECDAQGYVKSYSSASDERLYTNVYGADGHLAEIASDLDADGVVENTLSLEWEDQRVVRSIATVPSGGPELPIRADAYTFREDGWVATRVAPESGDLLATWRYDDAGRIVGVDAVDQALDVTYTYTGPDDVFPSAAELVDYEGLGYASALYTLSCP
jgi:hypothetical protein